MTSALFTTLDLGPKWTRPAGVGNDVSSGTRWRYEDGGATIDVVLQRCINGRLRNAYPVSAHDVEVRLIREVTPARLTTVLAELADAIQVADASCRRIVFTATAGDLAMIQAAESAGFRYVLDVDVPGAELSLLVAEPDWVTINDLDLDRVPGV